VALVLALNSSMRFLQEYEAQQAFEEVYFLDTVLDTIDN
jgi:hypothetical protein